MIINVEQHDIDAGVKISCRQCPVARAINRVLLNGLIASVTQSSTCVGQADIDGNLWCYATPIEASIFISMFDASYMARIKPFSFVLNIPEHFVKREWVLKSKKELTLAEEEELCDIVFWSFVL